MLRATWSDVRRFGLRDVMQMVLLAGGVLALVRFVAPSPGSPLRTPLDYVPWIATGLGLGVVTAISSSLVGVRLLPWYVRLLVVLVLGAMTGVALARFENGLGMFADYTSAGMSDPARAFNYCVTVVFALALAGWLALSMAAGWTLRARPTWKGIVSDTAAAVEIAPRRRRLANVMSWGIAGCVLAFLATAYWNLLPPQPPKVELPKPNGYDEIVKATQRLNWTAIPGQDVEETKAENCRAFAAANAAVLAEVRQALLLPSRTPIVYDWNQFSGTTLVGIQHFRELARALVAEARGASADGRHGDAASVYIDILRLAPALSNGGLNVDALVGDALIGVGVAGLVAELPQLDAQSLAELAGPLKTATARESIEQLRARDREFSRISYGWRGRLWLWSDEVLHVNGILRASETAMVSARARTDAQLRLLLADAALRRYILERGTPPTSLEILVPEYLDAVPDDPFSEGPLAYRATDDGYLLYSVGSDGVDDGGLRVPLRDATRGMKGDLFVEAK